jgi:RHS repeat-associated protein
MTLKHRTPPSTPNRGAHPARRPWPVRALAALLAGTVTLLGCPRVPRAHDAVGGLVEYQEHALVPFRFGVVNAISGNLHLRRVDLSIDTRLGTFDIGAAYNSARNGWLWSFDVTYDGVSFLDPSGVKHDVSNVPDGSAVPGSSWVKLGSSEMKTKSGLTFSFNAAGRLASLHWGNASYPRLEHLMAEIAGEPHTVEIRQCTAFETCTMVYAISYDDQARIAKIEDRAGRRAEFEWDEGGLVAARDGLDVAEQRPGWSYENDKNLIFAMTNGEGERCEFDYAARRVLEIVEVGEGNPVQSFHYEDASDPFYTTRYWDALGNERRFYYDAFGRLHEIEEVTLAERTTWTWIGLRPESETRASGATTRWAWVADDLKTQVQPSGNVVQYTYDPNGTDRSGTSRRAIARIEDSLGLVEERSYDAAGRLTSFTNGAGEVTSLSYDGSDTITVRRPSGVSTSLSGYGEHGHPTRITNSPLSEVSSETRSGTRERTFDAVGNRLRGGDLQQPEAGGLSGRRYDEDRNLRVIELDGGEEISIDVRSDGRRTAIHRPGGDDHEMDYDRLGRLVTRRERVDASWSTTYFEYDASHRPTAVERANGMREEYEYDAAGRRTLTRTLRSGALGGTLQLAYAAGELISAIDSIRAATETFEYDTAGRTTRVRHGDGTETRRSYDLRSRIVSETYLLDEETLLREIRFGYDLSDRRTEVRDGERMVLERVYLEGDLAETHYGNGLSRSYSYDAATGLPSGSQTIDAAGTVVESTTLSHTFAPGGPIRTAAMTTTDGGVAAASYEHYDLVPVFDADPESGARLGAWTDSLQTDRFHYDAKSNLLSIGSTVLASTDFEYTDFKYTDFKYNSEGNRLLSMTSAGGAPLEYTYDEAGFATSRGDRSITWTASGRMASHGSDEIAWDLTGRPISATLAGVESTWLFGAAVAGDAAGNPLQIDLGEVLIDVRTGAHRYRHLDFRGNVKFTSDDDGTLLSHYRYSPYGLEQVHGADDDPVRFVARAEIGELMVLGARIYDPAIGRFLSPDPVFQLVNQYAYTQGNPVWFSDRDGASSSYEQQAAIAAFVSTVLGLSAVFFPTIAALPALAVVFAFMAAYFALLASFQVEAQPTNLCPCTPALGADGFGTPSSGGAGFHVSGASVSGIACSPATLGQTPYAPYTLYALLPIQALLGLLLLRRRRRMQEGRQAHGGNEGESSGENS